MVGRPVCAAERPEKGEGSGSRPTTSAHMRHASVFKEQMIIDKLYTAMHAPMRLVSTWSVFLSLLLLFGLVFSRRSGRGVKKRWAAVD